MTSPVEIHAKSILRKMRKVDSWFLAGCGMNIYRGCAHDCAYCDGRAEKYQVQGTFGSDIQVKVNAVDVLRRELGIESFGQAELWPGAHRRTRRIPRRRHGGFGADVPGGFGADVPGGFGADVPGGFVLLGGGVGDSYQPAEKSYGLARRVLELLAENAIPVHVLTKSALVLRDADLLERIARTAGALVSFSLSSSDDGLSSVFEPGAAPPSERLRAISSLRSRGINAGVFLVPVLPFLTDDARSMEESVAAAESAGALYVVFGGMTLKPGKQKDHYMEILARERPDLVPGCRELYASAESARGGNAPRAYEAAVTASFARAARRHSMPIRIPLALAAGVLDSQEMREMRAAHARAEREMSRYLA